MSALRIASQSPYIVHAGRPVPERSGFKRRYPFDTMNVGDSFDIPKADMPRSGTSCLRRCAKWAGIKIATRDLGEVVRVWRTQ